MLWQWIKAAVRHHQHSKGATEYLISWERATLAGSDAHHRGDHQFALKQFEQAYKLSQQGMLNPESRQVFMHYYSLSSMNLAHLLSVLNKNSQTEKVLSDAHFKLLALMLDQQQADSVRHEARVQSEALLKNLVDFLCSAGRFSVAENLKDEFQRLRLRQVVSLAL